MKHLGVYLIAEMPHFGIFFIDGNTSITALVGVMSGAVTNTPGLGAAQQAILQVNPDAYTMSEEMAMGYAILRRHDYI